MKFLLEDEKGISQNNYNIRKKLYNEFVSLPVDFLSKMRHFQPQVGCFNNCGFCSKFSVCKSEYWNEETVRNIVSAIKYAARNNTRDDILLAWDRQEHRIGVNFPYLDNDIAGYKYLDKFLELCYKELGVKNRISTVGFSRHNKHLNDMHNYISNELLYTLAGVRLSISQYGRVWEDKNNASLEEYEKDITNFLKIYKKYYDYCGSGARKMCVEIRYNPLVENSEVITTTYNDKMLIAVGNYLFISKEENIKLNESHIKDPYIHSIEIDEEPVIFEEYNMDIEVSNEEELINYINNNELKYERDMETYLFSNRDGIYYTFNPKITNEGNYGFNIYPKTEARSKSGYLITERFLLNAIYEFKRRKGMNLRSIYTNSTWDDVEEVLNICDEISNDYLEKGKKDKADYIKEHVIPLVSVYVRALKDAGYSSDCFFDSKFTIDTGTICNLGRAITLFKGLSSFVNEPLTPTHERNYGRYCSTMKQENYVWKLSAGFDNTVVIEKLDLFNTASAKGQISFRRTLKIDNVNEKTKEDVKYLYPGARK